MLLSGVMVTYPWWGLYKFWMYVVCVPLDFVFDCESLGERRFAVQDIEGFIERTRAVRDKGLKGHRERHRAFIETVTVTDLYSAHSHYSRLLKSRLHHHSAPQLTVLTLISVVVLWEKLVASSFSVMLS